MLDHVVKYFNETAKIAGLIDYSGVESLVNRLVGLRERGGRLFIAGLGGSAANASHAANDFRRLCGIETYALNDSVAELTACANDDGWEHIYVGAMRNSRFGEDDGLLVLSVGGGTEKVSLPLVCAMMEARDKQASIFAIVGRDGGLAKSYAAPCIIIPTISPERVTPHTEAFQSVVLHALVSHPKLQINATKWQS